MGSRCFDIEKEHTLEYLADSDADLFLFGSHADGTSTRASDIDIGVFSREKFDRKIINHLHSILDESIVPNHIDIVDFYSVADHFREIALKKIIVWKRAQNSKLN